MQITSVGDLNLGPGEYSDTPGYESLRDSYPHAFGLQVLNKIFHNVSKEEFEEWLKKTRENVYAQRDNLVFHVDSQPLFRLDNMPNDLTFMEFMSFDRFGHRALHEHTQFCYDRRAPPPSPLPVSVVAYDRYNPQTPFMIY